MQKILVLSSQGSHSKNVIEESEDARVIPFLLNELLSYKITELESDRIIPSLSREVLSYRIQCKYNRLEFDGELVELIEVFDKLNNEV